MGWTFSLHFLFTRAIPTFIWLKEPPNTQAKTLKASQWVQVGYKRVIHSFKDLSYFESNDLFSIRIFFYGRIIGDHIVYFYLWRSGD